jgi:hypothetical protein
MWVPQEQTIQRPRAFDRVPGPSVKAVLEERFVSLTQVELGGRSPLGPRLGSAIYQLQRGLLQRMAVERPI